MTVEQRPDRIDRMAQRVDLGQGLEPVRGQGQRQQDARQEEERQGNRRDKRGQRVLALEDQSQNKVTFDGQAVRKGGEIELETKDFAGRGPGYEIELSGGANRLTVDTR
jgi:hypothetical protein